jgi:hypothetical protein
MKFMQHCGQCPKWKAAEGTRLFDPAGPQVMGHCSKYDQDRHSQRELCLPVWEQEIRRVGKLIKASATQIKIAILEGPVLDPKRTFESMGVSMPTGKTKLEKVDEALEEAFDLSKPKGKTKKSQSEPQRNT